MQTFVPICNNTAHVDRLMQSPRPSPVTTTRCVMTVLVITRLPIEKKRTECAPTAQLTCHKVHMHKKVHNGCGLYDDTESEGFAPAAILLMEQNN